MFRVVYESSQNGSKSATATGGNQATVVSGRAPEYEGAFTISDLARVALKRLWVIVLVVAVVVGAAVGVSFWQTPTYEASALLMVGQEPVEGQNTNLGGSVEGLQQLTQNMTIAIGTRPVAEEAIRRLGLEMSPDELLNKLTIEQVETSQFIRLGYTDTDPVRAQQIVNTVGAVSSERISQASVPGGALTATVYERAIIPGSPVSPDPVRNGILAAALGLMLGTALAFLMEYLDRSWRSSEEVEQISGVPNFATIPEFSLKKREKVR